MPNIAAEQEPKPPSQQHIEWTDKIRALKEPDWTNDLQRNVWLGTDPDRWALYLVEAVRRSGGIDSLAETAEKLFKAGFERSHNDGYALGRQVARPYELARSLIAALNRCIHGRHFGDPCFMCPDGDSAGNSYLEEGTRIGTTLYGAPIVVPEEIGRDDPAKWCATGRPV